MGDPIQNEKVGGSQVALMVGLWKNFNNNNLGDLCCFN